MAVEGSTPVNPQVPGGMEIPSLKTPDYQLMAQDYAQSRRELFEEKRNSEKKILAEIERSRWEAERIRSDYDAKIKTIEHENLALVRAIGRINSENDRLREENAVLRFSKARTEAPTSEKVQPSDKPADISHSFRPAPPLHVSIMPVASVMGKQIPMDPTKI